MKGLLLKDFYLMTKYCRAYLIIIATFAVVAAFDEGNTFFLLYVCIIASMIPVTLFSYDERDHWSLCAGALPYTKSQLVSVKYVVGIITGLIVVVITLLSQSFQLMQTGTFRLDTILPLLLFVAVLSLIAPAILMPFVFRYGAEKGRIFYYFAIGILVAFCTFMAKSYPSSFQLSAMESLLPLCLGSIAFYIISWLLSIAFYKRRES